MASERPETPNRDGYERDEYDDRQPDKKSRSC